MNKPQNNDSPVFLIELLYSKHLSDDNKLKIMKTLHSNNPNLFNLNFKNENTLFVSENYSAESQLYKDEYIKQLPFYINALLYKKDFFYQLIDNDLLSLTALDQKNSLPIIYQIFFTSFAPLLFQYDSNHKSLSSQLNLLNEIYDKYHLSMEGGLNYKHINSSLFSGKAGDNILELSIKSNKSSITKYLLSLPEYNFQIANDTQQIKSLYRSMIMNKNLEINDLHFNILNNINIDPNSCDLYYANDVIFEKIINNNSAYDKQKFTQYFSTLLSRSALREEEQILVINKLPYLDKKLLSDIVLEINLNQQKFKKMKHLNIALQKVALNSYFTEQPNKNLKNRL